jgi:hypothetical protein
MTDEMMDFRALEKAPDADILREMIAFAAERMMEMEVGAVTGAPLGTRPAQRPTQTIAVDRSSPDFRRGERKCDVQLNTDAPRRSSSSGS